MREHGTDTNPHRGPKALTRPRPLCVPKCEHTALWWGAAQTHLCSNSGRKTLALEVVAWAAWGSPHPFPPTTCPAPLVTRRASSPPGPPLRALRGKAGTEGQPAQHAGKQGGEKTASETTCPSTAPPSAPAFQQEQVSPYLCVFRAENSSEMICFKKLKQKKKI